MNGLPLDAEELLDPPDEPNMSPKTQRWLRRGGLFLAGTMLAVGFILLSMFPGVPKLGALAWADETARDRKRDIEAAVQPLVTAQAAQQRTLDGVVSLLKKQNDLELLKTVLVAKKEECAAKREGRSADYWSEQVVKLRNQYREETGQAPDVPTSCAEL